MRIGIFGGTFDPPHIGHLIVAQDALEHLSLDRVVFLPAGQPPHKQDRAITDGAIRSDLVRAAVEGDGRYIVDDRELRREGPSYTVDTLREYRREYPEAPLFLLMGSDQYGELHTWRSLPEILELAVIAVLQRRGAERGGEAIPANPRIVPVPVTRIDISSTRVRDRVRSGAGIRYLVPPSVEARIASLGLYAGEDRDRNAVGAPG